MKNVLVWGGKSQSRIIEAMLSDIFSDSIGDVFIFDPYLSEPYFESKSKFLNSIDGLGDLLHKSNINSFCLGIGGEHGRMRYELGVRLAALGLTPLDVISPYSVIDTQESFGVGVQIMPAAVIHKFTSVGDFSILNTNCTVDHECVLGDGVHIMGGASIAGNVKVNCFATIGTNATILPNLIIGEGAYVGAGAVVTENIAPYTVVKGVPAKKCRMIEPVVNYSLMEKLERLLGN